MTRRHRVSRAAYVASQNTLEAAVVSAMATPLAELISDSADGCAPRAAAERRGANKSPPESA